MGNNKTTTMLLLVLAAVLHVLLCSPQTTTSFLVAQYQHQHQHHHGTSITRRSHNYPTASLIALQFSLGNKDFANIFGKQEAEERRQRDVEMEFKARHNSRKEKEDDKKSGNSKDDDKNPTTTKKIGKYVPPPAMGTKTTKTSKNISPLLDGNYK